jgi:hypothetical protein
MFNKFNDIDLTVQYSYDAVLLNFICGIVDLLYNNFSYSSLCRYPLLNPRIVGQSCGNVHENHFVGQY